MTLDKADKVEKIDIQGTNESFDTIPIEVSSFDLEEEMYLTGRVGTDTEEKTFQVNRDALLVEKDGDNITSCSQNTGSFKVLRCCNVC